MRIGGRRQWMKKAAAKVVMALTLTTIEYVGIHTLPDNYTMVQDV